MGERFKLEATDYSQKVRTFKNSFDEAKMTADVGKASKCSGLIVNEYVNRANQLVELILSYEKLVKKDGAELNDIVKDLMRQESEWAQTIHADS